MDTATGPVAHGSGSASSQMISPALLWRMDCNEYNSSTGYGEFGAKLVC